MVEAAMSTEFLPEFAVLHQDALADELPADFAGFDDELPDELPADFADFHEDGANEPSALEAPSPSMSSLSKAQTVGFGPSRLLEPLGEKERDLVTGFADILGATVTHVIPRSAPDPVFPCNAPHDWDTWRRGRDDRIFTLGRQATSRRSLYEQQQEKDEEERRERQRRKDWLRRQRLISHGWAKYVYWLEHSPEESKLYRQQHEDEKGEWLVEIAVSPRFRVRPKASVAGKLKRLNQRKPTHVRMGS
jgi:hypothetical protein